MGEGGRRRGKVRQGFDFGSVETWWMVACLELVRDDRSREDALVAEHYRGDLDDGARKEGHEALVTGRAHR